MKNKKKEVIIVVLAVLGILLITLGTSYAFFKYGKEGTMDNSVKMGSVTFLYTEISGVGKGINIEDSYPMSDELGKVQTGEGKVFDFKITSKTSSSVSIPYEITARKSSDSSLDEEAVKVYLTKVEEGIEQQLVLKNYDKLKTTTQIGSSKYVEKTLYKGKVPKNSPNYEQAFRLRMWIDDSIDYAKDSEGNITYPYNDKTFTLTVNVYADGKTVSDTPKGTLRRIVSDQDRSSLWPGYKSSITKIVFQDELNEIENAISFDLSQEGNGSVMSYLVLNEDSKTYTAYIQGEGGVKANPDSYCLFLSYTQLQTIENLEYLDTSDVFDMSYMFQYCSSLTNLDLSNFDTSNVTNMAGMFSGCNSLTNLDLSGWDTSKVNDMHDMFAESPILNTTLTISNPNLNNYNNIFKNTATQPDRNITVNYTSSTSSLVDSILSSYSSNPNIIKGIQLD